LTKSSHNKLDITALKDSADLRAEAEAAFGAPSRRTKLFDVYSAPDRVDRTPSLFIYDDHYYDYGDHSGTESQQGDIITFLQWQRGMDFLSAAKYLGGDVSEKLPAKKRKQYKTKQPTKETWTVEEYEARFNTSRHLVEYLTSRGISMSVAFDNQISYEESERVVYLSSNKKIKVATGRIILPYVFNDVVKGWNGRRDDIYLSSDWSKWERVRPTICQDIIDQYGEKWKERVYGRRFHKTGQSHIFSVGQVLEIVDDKPRSKECPYVMICEGELDALALQSLGYSAIAAKPRHEYNLPKVLSNVVFKFILADNDAAGFKYAHRLYDMLGGAIGSVRVLTPAPKYKDFGDMIIDGCDVRGYLTDRYGITAEEMDVF